LIGIKRVGRSMPNLFTIGKTIQARNPRQLRKAGPGGAVLK
jgi:hypothetical protein